MRVHKIVDATGVLNTPERAMLQYTLASMNKWRRTQKERDAQRALEVCGYLDPLGVTLVPNVDPRPGRFAFPDDVVRHIYEVAGTAGRVTALWHSHPNGRDEPSEPDQSAHPRFVPFSIIVNPLTGRVTWWEM